MSHVLRFENIPTKCYVITKRGTITLSIKFQSDVLNTRNKQRGD